MEGATVPRNGSGTYARAVASYVYNTTIDQVVVNAEMDDLASALTASIAKNGETTPTANLPMGTYRHTNVGNGSARTDYAAMGQAQDGKINWVDGGGTADAITATYSPVITALVDGQLCHVRATAANATTTPTFSPNSLTARTIVKNGGVALVAGDIAGDGHELILRYDLTNTRWELLNVAPDLSSKQPLHANLTALAAGNATIAWPIGSVHISTVATNPATSLGGGTWVSFGAGRVLVGLDAAQTEFDTVEEVGGAKTHTLTTAEIPAHLHAMNADGRAVAKRAGIDSVIDGTSSTASAEDADYAGSQNTGNTGGGGAHNNLQPYIVVYFWKRTA